MRKYVDTVELQDRLFGKLNNGSSLEDALCKFFAAVVDETPAADVVEVVRGKWDKHGNGVFTCSVCSGATTFSYCYCPNCGANMCKEVDEK